MKQYLQPNTTGPVNGILVKSQRVADLYLVHKDKKKNKSFDYEKTVLPCSLCAFSSVPFDCWAGNPWRPACCCHDKDNASNESLYFVRV